MATLKRKIIVRKGHKNHTENLLNDIDQSWDDRIKIKSLINSLIEKNSLIKQLHHEILDLIESENDIEKEIESTSEFSDKLQIAFAKLENILSEQNDKETSSTIPTASLVTSLNQVEFDYQNTKYQNFRGMLFSGKVFGIITTLKSILQQ